MKTLRISDVSHKKLTATVGTLMAQTSKMQTYQDAIEAMLNQSVKLPSELLAEIENFIETNKQLGFTTREEFIRDAVRWRLKFLNEGSEYLEIPREKYERLDAAIKEMSAPYHGASDFIHKQIGEVLEKYEKWQEEKEENEKRQRKKSERVNTCSSPACNVRSFMSFGNR
jgi:Arc/MetJ-type ribon-helix-helix transcriptional regulator